LSLRQVLIAVASILAIGLASCAPATAQYLSAPPAPPRPPTPRDVCHQEFGNNYDPYGRWIGSVVTTLCNDGNADSKLAVYLLTVPPVEGTHAQPDEALLARALAGVGEKDAPLLFVAAMHASADCSDGLARAKRLTDADPDNGVAWLTRASLATCDADAGADEAMSSLRTAALSRRFHDYGFDIMKRVAARLARVPVPAEVVASQHAETPDQVRFEDLKQTLIVWMGLEWTPALDLLGQTCPEEASQASDDLRVACEGAKRGLSRYGDSVALLMVDPERSRAAMKDVEAVLGDPREALVAKVAMRTLAQSHSENEFYRRTRALIGEPKAPAEAH
jgi:hypothetical protein